MCVPLPCPRPVCLSHDRNVLNRFQILVAGDEAGYGASRNPHFRAKVYHSSLATRSTPTSSERGSAPNISQTPRLHFPTSPSQRQLQYEPRSSRKFPTSSSDRQKIGEGQTAPLVVEDAEAIHAATKLGYADRKRGRRKGIVSAKAVLVACRMTLTGKADSPGGVRIRVRPGVGLGSMLLTC